MSPQIPVRLIKLVRERAGDVCRILRSASGVGGSQNNKSDILVFVPS